MSQLRGTYRAHTRKGENRYAVVSIVVMQDIVQSSKRPLSTARLLFTAEAGSSRDACEQLV